MADGLNNSRALRVLELMNDFQTLQVHIRDHVTRVASSAPTADQQNLVGYQLLAQCRQSAQAILAAQFNTNLVQPGQVADSEEQRQNLRRLITDAATRRFRAHKVYLLTSAAVRWIAYRQQLLGGQAPNGRHAAALATIDQRLRQEIQQFTDNYVYTNLRTNDANRNYWLTDDPDLAAILAYRI